MHIPQTTNSITVIHRQDKNYPVRLNDLYDPPKVLYIYGDIGLLQEPMIAIVGSRLASHRGIQNASAFARALSKAGLVVLSGMARGIDAAAHQATLGLENGLTLAVCGTGIDIVYPREHANLATAIGKKGLLLTELPPGTGPKPFHFPRRNRLIAALALGVVVIEAADKSGSLITARIAAELGREVFALPGPVGDPQYRGCHRLIQEGAKLVVSPDEVLEDVVTEAKPPFKAARMLF
jgi:DNA processing protein